METFTIKEKTKNDITILVCGICSSGTREKCAQVFKNGIENAFFPETVDEYFLDYSLMLLLVQMSINDVVALGASISVTGVNHRSGGIIGNPFEETQSAEDEISDLGNGLFEVAFAGRFGAVFQGDMNIAISVKETFEKLTHFNSVVAVKNAVEFLDAVSNQYIFVSDGSGEGGYPYVCARSGKIKEELSE